MLTPRTSDHFCRRVRSFCIRMGFALSECGVDPQHFDHKQWLFESADSRPGQCPSAERTYPVRTYPHTHIPTYTHTHIHTYTHTHIPNTHIRTTASRA